MKYLIVAITFIAVSTSCMVGGQNKANDKSTTPNEKVATNLKDAKGEIVGFYNVENLFDTIDDKYTIDEQFLPSSEKQWTSDRYLTKLDQLGKVIASMKSGGYPVFMGLAEIENKQVIEDLVGTKQLKDAGYEVVHKDSPDKRGIDLGFIYRKDYFQYLSHEALEVSLEDNPDFFTRDILYVKGKFKGDDVVHIFLNHWPSRREGAAETEYRRVRAATVLRNKVDEVLAENENAKIIIMGDFNDYPVDKSLYQTLRARKDRKFDNGDLYNTAYALEKQDLGTYNYKGDWGMLDQLIISKGFFKAENGVTITAKDCQIHKLDWMLYTDPKYGDQKPSKTYGGPEYYGGYSDHLPIYIELN